MSDNFNSEFDDPPAPPPPPTPLLNEPESTAPEPTAPEPNATRTAPGPVPVLPGDPPVDPDVANAVARAQKTNYVPWVVVAVVVGVIGLLVIVGLGFGGAADYTVHVDDVSTSPFDSGTAPGPDGFGSAFSTVTYTVTNKSYAPLTLQCIPYVEVGNTRFDGGALGPDLFIVDPNSQTTRSVDFTSTTDKKATFGVNCH